MEVRVLSVPPFWRGNPKGKEDASKASSTGRKAPWDFKTPPLRHFWRCKPKGKADGRKPSSSGRKAVWGIVILHLRHLGRINLKAR